MIIHHRVYILIFVLSIILKYKALLIYNRIKKDRNEINKATEQRERERESIRKEKEQKSFDFRPKRKVLFFRTLR